MLIDIMLLSLLRTSKRAISNNLVGFVTAGDIVTRTMPPSAVFNSATNKAL